MSDTQDTKPLLDLSELRLMPKWVSDFGKTGASSAPSFEEVESRTQRHGGKDHRGGQRGGANRPPFQRQGQNQGQGRRQDGGHSNQSGKSFQGNKDRGPRAESNNGRPPFRQDRDRNRFGKGQGPRRDFSDRPHFEKAPPLPEGLTAEVEPEARATESMAGMIRNAGKAYSVFDAARLVLASGDRFHVKFSFAKDSAQKLYAIPADGSLWLSREDAVNHFLHSEGLNEFYKVEEVELEEPKGNFSSIAICGMTGELLGPPSHHSYQANLHRLHRERFAHLSFEDYKRRVRTETGPEIVEKWKQSQKHGVQWTLVTHNSEPEEVTTESVVETATPVVETGTELSDSTPDDTAAESTQAETDDAAPKSKPAPSSLVFKSRAEMETHFRKTFAEGLVHETSTRYVAGNIPKNHLSPQLFHLLRRTVDEARKHLLAVAQRLCTGFEQNGLKLFKRRGGKLWVSRVRPRLLDTTVVLSERISRMVEVVKANPGITTKALVEAVVPNTPAAEESSATADLPTTVETDTATEANQSAEATSADQALPSASASIHHEATPDQLAALKDLHWLNSEGYVIEYADGVVFPGVTEPPPAKPKAPKKAPAGEQDQTSDTSDAASSVETDTATLEAEGDVTAESISSADVPSAEGSEESPENAAAEIEELDSEVESKVATSEEQAQSDDAASTSQQSPA